MPEAAQAPTPSQGPQGSDLGSVATQIEGLLDGDGHYNPNPDQLSRGHPDYDETADPRAGGERKTRDDKGRFKAKSAPPDEDDSPDDDVAPETGDTAEDDVSDADTDDGDTDEELAKSGDEDTDDADEGTEPVRSVAEMAEALEMSVDDFLEAITDSFTAAGEDVTVTLAELRKGYQKDADYRRGTAKLAEDKKRVEQEYATRMQQFETQSREQAAQLQAMEQVIVRQLDSPAMQQLRQQNPAEWTARREELGQQIGFIQQARQNAAQQYNKTQVDYLQGVKNRSMQALQEAVPDFGSKHGDTAREVMKSIGYTDTEVSKIFDHRLVLGALELDSLRTRVAELEAEKAEAKKTAKHVKKSIPAMTKPGKTRSAGSRGVKRDQLTRLRGNLKKSGRVEDAGRVIEHLI